MPNITYGKIACDVVVLVNKLYNVYIINEKLLTRQKNKIRNDILLKENQNEERSNIR